MKQLSLILSSLALVGVVALFVMKSKDKSPARQIIKTKDSTGKEVIVSGSKIAYVDIDTLEANYDYFKRKKSEFETRQKNIDAELEKSANQLQNDYEVLRKKAESGQLSQTDGEAAQQRLMQRQQELELKRQNLGTKYMKDQEAFNKEIHDNLHRYIEIYNEEKGYDFILSYSKDGSILFANKDLDVTQDIIEGMNSKNFESKTSSPSTDTTK
ncbi:MAG: OmpH family outer membrane protein [Chitinophagaceae bacterium]|nr:OmpH family outer membrane protein [Chitinophagaceae bacterium]